jgi:hypothetical protein
VHEVRPWVTVSFMRTITEYLRIEDADTNPAVMKQWVWYIADKIELTASITADETLALNTFLMQTAGPSYTSFCSRLAC